jgi:hypothetical protein
LTAVTLREFVGILKPYGPDTATRFGLCDARIHHTDPRRVVFLLDDAPSTVERLTEVVARAAKLSPRFAADLTLRCYLWDKPITARLIATQIIGEKPTC